jgi:hypothetical protein
MRPDHTSAINITGTHHMAQKGINWASYLLRFLAVVGQVFPGHISGGA